MDVRVPISGVIYARTSTNGSAVNTNYKYCKHNLKGNSITTIDTFTCLMYVMYVLVTRRKHEVGYFSTCSISFLKLAVKEAIAVRVYVFW